jgi:phosphoglycolate phosphatase-like HAD superfamily hydrolase
MHRLSKYKSVIFDCDGVILQSNKIKTNAFRKVLENEQCELVEKFISYHQENGGISRYVKFAHYYQHIKFEDNYQLMANAAIKKFAHIVSEELIKASYVPGFINVIDCFNAKNIPCFVVSGGDQEELHHVFKQRKIFNKFIKVLGSPVEKMRHVKILMKNKEICHPSIFFGDAFSDMNAALENGMDFCYVSQFSEWKEALSMVDKSSNMIINNFEDFF